MSRDFLDLLAALIRAEARFLVIGAHALSAEAPYLTRSRLMG